MMSMQWTPVSVEDKLEVEAAEKVTLCRTNEMDEKRTGRLNFSCSIGVM
jgi:hypothetical protein